jgi:hypothetical protein
LTIRPLFAIAKSILASFSLRKGSMKEPYSMLAPCARWVGGQAGAARTPTGSKGGIRERERQHCMCTLCNGAVGWAQVAWASSVRLH